MSENLWDKYWDDEKNIEYWSKPADEVLDFINSCDPNLQPDILDLGCGLGRHAIAFAEAGFNVTATDLSATAVEKLNGIANKHKLPITGILADYRKVAFENNSFDIIISYNVIYHGSRDSFQEVINLCHDYLKNGGTFFFTCPTRSDGKYGSGQKVEEHTYESLNSVHPGDVHYFADENDIKSMCNDFSDISLKKHEHWWDNNGKKQFSSYMIVKIIK